VESAESLTTLDQLPVGSRLLVRSKKDWRLASVAAFRDDLVVISVCSSSGRTYRLRRQSDAAIVIDGDIPVLKGTMDDNWRENFSAYDIRW
jgi:hypothetical protein